MDSDLDKIFFSETRKKKRITVHQDEFIVNNSDYIYNITVGSCASVVLTGKDLSGKVWFGVNHMFKSREENEDMSLRHVAELYNSLQEKNVGEIHCLGLFGAGYRKNSIAKNVATKNIIMILEALNLYGMTIELFQTGYSQGLSILKSDARNSILVKQYNINSKETKIMEIPLSKLFEH